MNTKQLRLATLSLALILPFTQVSAACKPSCKRSRTHVLLKRNGCGQVYVPVAAAPVVVETQASTPAAPVVVETKASTPAAPVEPKTEDNQDANQDSWTPWIIGGSAAVLAAVGALVSVILHKKGYTKYNPASKVSDLWNKKSTTPATEEAPAAPATPAAPAA